MLMQQFSLQCPVTDRLRNGPAVFWTGVLTHSCSAAIPVTVFFLSVNRILMITFPVAFSEPRQKMLLVLGIACIAVFAGVNFLAFVLSAFVMHPVPPETGASLLRYQCAI